MNLSHSLFVAAISKKNGALFLFSFETLCSSNYFFLIQRKLRDKTLGVKWLVYSYDLLLIGTHCSQGCSR